MSFLGNDCLKGTGMGIRKWVNGCPGVSLCCFICYLCPDTKLEFLATVY